MGLFSNFFSSKNSDTEDNQSQISWNSLTTIDQLSEIEHQSANKTQIIFKHSTTCGISGMVLRSFRNSYPLEQHQADVYYLDLHSYRSISDEVANRFKVYHQSPQLLIIKNGIVVAHESHGGINALELSGYV